MNSQSGPVVGVGRRGEESRSYLHFAHSGDQSTAALVRPRAFGLKNEEEAPMPVDSNELSESYIDHSADGIRGDSLRLLGSLHPVDNWLAWFEPHRPESSGQDSRLPFPTLLYKLISEASQDDQDEVVAWSSHGRSFVVHNREAFVNQLMPR